MALTPQNNEAFFREVDEEVRRDRMVGFFQRYGKLVAALVCLGLVALAGWLWWKAHAAALAGADSEALAPALAPMADGNAPADPKALEGLSRSSRPAYRTFAALALADANVLKGDAAHAAGQYDAVAADASAPQPVRDLATVRAVATRFETMPPQQVIDRLKPLATPGNPWFGSAGEMTALALLKLGRKDQAGQLLARIAADADAPATLRGRAAGLATLLGRQIDPAAATTAPKE